MRRLPLLTAFAFLWLFGCPGSNTALLACEFCLPEGPMSPMGLGLGPNTYWLLEGNVWTCPAGDSVAAVLPSKLRIEVWYADANCLGKVGVPPESIWVSYSTVAGNLVVNDKGLKIYADDSTDACAHTRITIASFSGCGTLRLNLYVSGIFQGSKIAFVNSLDLDANGRVGAIDYPFCDPAPGSTDLSALLLAHDEHWHRNVLHGTLVRRTNLYYGEHQPGSYGGSQVFWNPSGRWLSYTLHELSGNACHAYIIPSDPAIGTSRSSSPGHPTPATTIQAGCRAIPRSPSVAPTTGL